MYDGYAPRWATCALPTRWRGTPAPPAAAPLPGGPPGYGWQPNPPVPKRGRLLAIGVTVAILLATAALVIGIVLLVRPAPAPPASPASPARQPQPLRGDTTDADRALCTAIAPLMGETDRTTKAWVDLGEAGTPARDAATPKFITDTQDWVRRIQPVLDQHPDVDPFLKRSLQRFIDDQHLMVVDLTPGPLSSYAKALYNDGTGAYSGPLHVCDGLGVKWGSAVPLGGDADAAVFRDDPRGIVAWYGPPENLEAVALLGNAGSVRPCNSGGGPGGRTVRCDGVDGVLRDLLSTRHDL